MPTHNSLPEREIRVIQSFSKYARSYDRYAQLQKSMAERLAALLPEPIPDIVLEIGCGTGIFTRHLLVRSLRQLILNDISPAMAEYLTSQIAIPENTRIVIGNAEKIALPSSGLIVANAVVQWFENPENTLKRLARSLPPGGRFVFSTFGPETLRDFRLIAEIESPARLNSLVQWKKIIRESGYKVVQAISETRKIFFPSTLILLKSLQQIGAAPLRLIKTGDLRKRLRRYDKEFSTPQGVYAGWELYYFSVEKPRNRS